jgi:hypothetical protein
MSADKSGPAYPWTRERHPQEAMNSITSGSGMTLRQWYAGLAISGLVGASHGLPIGESNVYNNVTLAKVAFAIADAMIAEGEK